MQKRALILSQAHLEGTTDYVCQWLNHLKIPYLRLNGEDLFNLNNLGEISIDDQVSTVWYRRKIANFPASYKLKNDHYDTKYTIQRFLIDEFNGIHSYLFYKFQRNKWLNDPFVENGLNKLQVIALANSFGISTPFTEVVTKKETLKQLYKQHGELIVKPISECIIMEDQDGMMYKMLTKTINDKNMHQIPDEFFPSLVQKKVDKKFEIRTYYLEGECHSMAIFSQNNKKTKEDFRNYDNERPNRTVPYKLPLAIENKLDSLMKALSFRTGSIDLMVDEKGNYQFLEINPEGQFGMVSYPCNYYLERKMAHLLGN